MKTKRTCPLIDRECMGRDCAMAVFVNSANVSAYNVLWAGCERTSV